MIQVTQKNLELLKGKLDNNRFNAIANRLQQVGAGAGAAAQADGGEGEAGGGNGDGKDDIGAESTVLEDFILQAEIFMQYGMRTKAVERLERIHKVFPREEDKNERFAHTLQQCRLHAEIRSAACACTTTARRAGFAVRTSAELWRRRRCSGPTVLPQLSNDENAVDNFTRVTEITRNIYRQSTVKGVLFAAVNDVGRHYKRQPMRSRTDHTGEIADRCARVLLPWHQAERCAAHRKTSGSTDEFQRGSGGDGHRHRLSRQRNRRTGHAGRDGIT